jgi:DNA-binding protein H-NS
MSNYEDLVKQRELLDRQIKEVWQRDKQEAIDKIKILIDQHQITAQELFTKRASGSSQANKKVAAKYRNPQTGETWTGRGKTPAWIAGQNRDVFLIQY